MGISSGLSGMVGARAEGAWPGVMGTGGEDVNQSVMPAPIPARGAGGERGVEEVAEVRQVTYSVLRNFLSRNTPNVREGGEIERRERRERIKDGPTMCTVYDVQCTTSRRY